jgi:hypothetical protein
MFRKIGEFEISIEDDLMLVSSSSEFNVESAREYRRVVAPMMKRMPPVFGVLALFETPPVLDAEVEASMLFVANSGAQHGMSAVAFVVADGAGLSIARGQWARIYEPSGLAHAFFRDVESARAWLREQLERAKRG